MNRRNFLKVSATGLVGAGISAKTPASFRSVEDQTPKIEEYSILGRTGFKVSRIGIGSSNQQDNFHENLLKAGMNYIDTSPMYNNEASVGKAIKGVDRESVFITVKFFPKEINKPEILVNRKFTKKDVLQSFYTSFEKLQTDYVDCFMMQSASSSGLVKNEAFHAAFEQLKREGKVRFRGVACHGSYWLDEPKETMEQILQTAIDDGRFDLILLVYNFLQHDQGERILEACHKKDIGTLVMKGNPISRYNSMIAFATKFYNDTIPEGKPTRVINKLKKEVKDFDRFKENYGIKTEYELRDSAVKFVLNNPNVNTYLYGFKSYDDIQKIVALSGQKLTSRDTRLMRAYQEDYGTFYCRHACGICESACPHKVPINKLLRYRHYHVGNGNEAYALRKYNDFKGPKADHCIDCEGYCEQACPYDVHAQAMLIDAHLRLNLA